jgi:hypothetical protein
VLRLTGGSVGAGVDGNLALFDDARCFVESGTVDGNVETRGTAVCEVSGGSVGISLNAFDASRIVWSGGTIGNRVRAENTATIRIVGQSFVGGFGTVTGTTGTIQGVLLDGTPFSVPYRRGASATIVLVPEPALWLSSLCAIGALAWRRRRVSHGAAPPTS